MSPSHPDFELYDNVGRTSEQIKDHRGKRPTTDDLHRWAAHDAKQFTDALTIEDAGQSVIAWSRQLYRVHTTPEFQAVATAVLGEGHSALSELHQFLETAAEWCERNHEPKIAERYRRHAEQLSELGDQLSYLTDDHLADTYRRHTRQNRHSPRAAPRRHPRHRPRPHAAPPVDPPRRQEDSLSTRSVIARPTADGYAGMYVHFDGYPDSKLPLLLAAYQHRFAGDVEAMARHLIDAMHHGWDELGTDLLDGAPATLRRSLTGGEEYPSRQLTNVYNTDGTPAERELTT